MPSEPPWENLAQGSNMQLGLRIQGTWKDPWVSCIQKMGWGKEQADGTKEKLGEEDRAEGKKKKEIKDFESHSIPILPKGNSAAS